MKFYWRFEILYSEIKVLVTDSNHRKALAAVRSLGKNGINVIAADKRKLSIAGISRYCSKSIKYPDPLAYSDNFIKYIEEYVTSNNVDIILPMEDLTTEIFSKNLKRFNGKAIIPFPNYDIYIKCRDKAETIKQAIVSGLPCPKTYFINNIAEVKYLSKNIEYPVVVKPRKSSGSRGITYVFPGSDLVNKYEAVHKEYPFPLLQEYIPQENRVQLQILLLINKNKEIIACCTQEFLRQYPVNGGPGTLWKTISLPELELKSMQFLKDLNWYGIACVEYVIDPRNGEPKFMEINPRFWGTLNLSIQVDVNFPLLLVKMALGEDLDPVYNKRLEEYCQWFLPGDILNFVFNKNRFKQKVGYLFNRPEKFHHVTFSREDTLPLLATILKLFLDLFNVNNLKNIFKRGK